MQASYNPIFNEYGKPFKVIKFASDITAEVMRRTELQTVSAQIDSDLTRILEGVTSAASQIGEIINLISSIAAQTNLLSLNATIEAARAGEAGRGFAVVAGEVKALANQSAKASDDISNQITSVQEATRSAVAAIEIISKVIEEVNDISVSISSAVEEQACVTRDISTNMGDATVAVNNISQGVHGIAEATNLIQTATEKVKSMSSRIAS